MINLIIDKLEQRNVEKWLDGLTDKSASALKKAVNDTASSTKRNMASIGYQNYVKKKSELNSAMRIKKATVSNRTAVINVSGPIQEPLDYKASPTTFSAQRSRRIAAKARILRNGRLKALQEGNRKAFFVEFKKNPTTGKLLDKIHPAIVQREYDDKRLPLKTFYSPSVSKLLGGDRVMDKVYPEIWNTLHRNVENQIKALLGR